MIWPERTLQPEQPNTLLQDTPGPSGMGRCTDLSDSDLPYRKRQKVREQWQSQREAHAQVPAGPQSALQVAPVLQRPARNAERGLWHDGQQRREEFGDLHSRYNGTLSRRALSGPAFLRLIRSWTDATPPLAGVPLPTERNDIRLFRIRVPGYEGDVHVLRRDAEGEMRDLRRLRRVGDERELRHVIAQMEKSAFQSHGRSAAARGKSVRHPHLSDLWEGSLRKQEFGASYSAFRRQPGKQDTTGAGFLAELHQLTVRAEALGGAKNTGADGIQLFSIQVQGTPGPIQVLRRLDAAGDLADIRLASPAHMEEVLDQMADSRAASRGSRMGSSAPRRDRRLSGLWRARLEKRLAGALEQFQRAQPGSGSTDVASFIRHLDELCDQSPGETLDDRYGISRHLVTPLGSTQPITLLRRKDAGELARMRVIDHDTTEGEALRSLRTAGPKRKPDTQDSDGPAKRRKPQERSGERVQRGVEKTTHAAHSEATPGISDGLLAASGAVAMQPQSGTARKPLHKVIVPHQHKEMKVDVAYLVTGAVGRMRGGIRTLEWAYANSPELVRPPRSHEGDRERQALRWLCSALLNAFPGGKEVQAYYDRAKDEVWISSNARGTNRKIRQFLNDGGLQPELQRQRDQTGKVNPDDRWARHASKLHRVLDEPSACHPDASLVLEAIARRRFRVPSEIFRVDGVARQIDLHAERRIKRAYEQEANTTLDPTKVVGTKRACGTCAEALQFPDTERRGPFWRSGAARAFVDLSSAVNASIAKGIPTHISRGRDGALNLYVSDSDSDA